jgi:pantothenate kinase type III
LIEKIVTLLQQQLGSSTTTIATGGLSGLIAQRTDKVQHADPDLILKGLQILFDMNQ